MPWSKSKMPQGNFDMDRGIFNVERGIFDVDQGIFDVQWAGNVVQRGSEKVHRATRRVSFARSVTETPLVPAAGSSRFKQDLRRPKAPPSPRQPRGAGLPEKGSDYVPELIGATPTEQAVWQIIAQAFSQSCTVTTTPVPVVPSLQ